MDIERLIEKMRWQWPAFFAEQQFSRQSIWLKVRTCMLVVENTWSLPKNSFLPGKQTRHPSKGGLWYNETIPILIDRPQPWQAVHVGFAICSDPNLQDANKIFPLFYAWIILHLWMWNSYGQKLQLWQETRENDKTDAKKATNFDARATHSVNLLLVNWNL